LTQISVTTICRSLSEIMASVTECRMLGALPLYRPRPHDGTLADMRCLRFLHVIFISVDVLKVHMPCFLHPASSAVTAVITHSVCSVPVLDLLIQWVFFTEQTLRELLRYGSAGFDVEERLIYPPQCAHAMKERKHCTAVYAHLTAVSKTREAKRFQELPVWRISIRSACAQCYNANILCFYCYFFLFFGHFMLV
jgi:hypothetical protein